MDCARIVAVTAKSLCQSLVECRDQRLQVRLAEHRIVPAGDLNRG